MREWKEVRFIDIAEIIGGGTPKKSKAEYWNGDICWLTVSDFNTGRKYVNNTELKITELGLQESSTKILKKGQIIISARGTVGIIAMLGENMAFNQSNYGINAIRNITFNDFLYYLLQFKIKELQQVAYGAVFNTITRTTFEQLNVNLPPLPEQKAIAEVLSSLDDKIDLLNRQNKTLEQMAETLFRQWFIEEAKEDWKVLKLSDIAEVKAGGDKPQLYSENKTDCNCIPIYSNGIKNKGLYGYTNTPQIKEESVTVSARGTIGFVALREEPYVPIVRLISLIPYKKKMTAKYLFLWLKTQKIKGNGTTQQQLTIPDFSSHNIVVPPYKIIISFTERINCLYLKIKGNNKQIHTLEKMRDTLLPKLISGEVRVKLE